MSDCVVTVCSWKGDWPATKHIYLGRTKQHYHRHIFVPITAPTIACAPTHASSGSMRLSLTIAFLALVHTTTARPHDFTTLIKNAQQIGNNRPLTLQTIPTHRNFSFAGCVPPDCRCDVCGMVAHSGSFAPLETRAYEFLGSKGCAHDGNTGLVVDVGANAGYFTAHALSMGCAVLALEPNPHVATLLQLNIALNRPKACLYNTMYVLPNMPYLTELAGAIPPRRCRRCQCNCKCSGRQPRLGPHPVQGACGWIHAA